MWWFLASALGATVCPKGCDFATVQEAVDSVPIGGDARFDVAAGTYREHVVVVDRTVRLVGDNVAGPPRYAPATDDVPVFTVTGGKLVLRQFALDADFVRGIDATDSDIELETGAMFGRGLADDGAVVKVDGGSLSATTVTGTGGTSFGRGGLISAHDADVSLVASAFTDSAALQGGCVAIQATEAHDVVLSGVLFSRCEATFLGGGLHLEGPLTVTANILSMQGNIGTDGGGALAMVDGVTMSLLASELTGNSSADKGGAIYQRGGSLSVRLAGLTAHSARRGGALYAELGATVDLVDVGFDANVAFEDGGAAFLQATTLHTTDTLFYRNLTITGDGGGLYLDAGSAAPDPVRTVFCANTADRGGGLFSAVDTDMRWHNARFLDNTVGREGGAVTHVGPGVASFVHTNFLGNSAGQRGGAAVLAGGPVVLENSLLAFHPSATAVVVRSDGSLARAGVNAWYDNAEGNLAGLSPNDDASVFTDPLLDRYEPGIRCEIAQDWPTSGSPIRNVVPGDAVDLDGSPADLGAFGGALARADVWTTDADDDGYSLIDDCDDGNIDVNPAQLDMPYDGLDADCDRADDFDADGDGFRPPDQGGTDCDDADPRTYPGAPETGLDPGDTNCDERLDADGDGFERFVGGAEEDCDDDDPSTYPGAPEDDGPVDRDCNGIIDGPRTFQLVTCATGPLPATGSFLLGMLVAGTRRRPTGRCAHR